MHRSYRSAKSLIEEFEKHPELGVLFYTLKLNEKIEVRADGTKTCLFKVYLKDRCGPNDAFLHVFIPPNKSYVDWRNHERRCKEVFGTIVISPRNSTGSYLKSGVATDEIVRIVRKYSSK